MINIDKILGQILGAGQAIDGKPFDGKSLAGGLLIGGLAGAMTGKTGKKIAGTALKLGGAAAVAGLAYSAYQRYRAAQQPGATTVAGSIAGASATDVTPLQEAHFLPRAGDEAATESLSLKLIRAMIGAAKADGRIDGSETDRIFGQTQLPQFGVCRDVKSADLLGFR